MRASTAGRTSRVRTKTHELAGIRALQRATEQLARRVSALCADVDRSADAAVGASSLHSARNFRLIACTVMGRVLEQWPQMFKVLALICT
jgi:hypothetical protein